MNRLARWRAENRDKHLAQIKRRSPAKVAAAKARYNQKHPEKKAAWESARRARVASSGGRVSSAEWFELKRSSCGVCVWCGRRRRLTLDHIAPISCGGEHGVENLAPVCGSCNSSKRDQVLIVWLARRAGSASIDTKEDYDRATEGYGKF